MGVPIPSGEITNKKDKDSLIIQRKTSSGWQSNRIDVDTFSGLIGSVGTTTPAVYETIVNENYTLQRAISSSGEFEIQVKYKVAVGSDFIVDLLPTQPAHVLLDRFADVVVETWKDGKTESPAYQGSWTMNRFYNNVTGLTNILQGAGRSEGEMLVVSRGLGSEVYNTGSDAFIDLTSTALSFGFLESVIGSDGRYAWRVVSFRGVLIKDNLV